MKKNSKDVSAEKKETIKKYKVTKDVSAEKKETINKYKVTKDVSAEKKETINKYKVISHASRMSDDSYMPHVNCKCEDCYIMQSYKVIDPVLNRFVTKSKRVKYDQKKKLSVYKVSDFSIENLTAIGSPLLGQSALLDVSRNTAVDNLETALSNLKQE